MSGFRATVRALGVRTPPDDGDRGRWVDVGVTSVAEVDVDGEPFDRGDFTRLRCCVCPGEDGVVSLEEKSTLMGSVVMTPLSGT